MIKQTLFTIFISVCFVCTVFAQTETLTNSDVITMTQAGLSRELIVRKIKDSKGDYQTTARDLIELKKAGVADEVIALMLDKKDASEIINDNAENKADLQTNKTEAKTEAQYIVLEPKKALEQAKTVAIEKYYFESFAAGVGKEIAQTQGLAAVELKYRSLQGRRGFVYRNRFRAAFAAYAPLRFSHLRQQKRHNHRSRRNDFLGKFSGKSGAAYFKKTK